MTLFRIGFLPVTVLDLIDILVVAVIFYQLFNLMRGTKAASMLIGLLFILVASFISQWLHLDSLYWVIGKLSAVWILAFLIVFQPELRGILTQLGQGRLLSRIVTGHRIQITSELIQAVGQMSDQKIGALMAIQRNVGLRGYAETGKHFTADISAPLIVAIFTPPGPMHDGAMIIEGNKIIAAGATLPLAQNQERSIGLGMRHQAALGLSEETDALIVVVSEENGSIAVAREGKIRRGVDLSQLRGLLTLALEPES